VLQASSTELLSMFRCCACRFSRAPASGLAGRKVLPAAARRGPVPSTAGGRGTASSVSRAPRARVCPSASFGAAYLGILDPSAEPTPRLRRPLRLLSPRQLARNPQDAQREDDENKSALFGCPLPRCCSLFRHDCVPTLPNVLHTPGSQRATKARLVTMLGVQTVPILTDAYVRVHPSVLASTRPFPHACRGAEAAARVRAAPRGMGGAQKALQRCQRASASLGCD
jgi:hypothetical protein